MSTPEEQPGLGTPDLGDPPLYIPEPEPPEDPNLMPPVDTAPPETSFEPDPIGGFSASIDTTGVPVQHPDRSG